jgi:hypothetical protein
MLGTDSNIHYHIKDDGVMNYEKDKQHYPCEDKGDITSLSKFPRRDKLVAIGFGFFVLGMLTYLLLRAFV